MIEAESVSASERPVVSVTDASVHLAGRAIWHDLNLDVYPGEFIALLGPNGAGKSTLIKAILGLVPLSHGSIRVKGVMPRQARGAVSYVPQRRSFGPETRIRGRDLVALGLDGARWGFPLPDIRWPWARSAGAVESRMRVESVIEAVDATPYADRPIGELSGGEQQRLLIAEALVTHPDVLLLDEPLDGLDLRNQQEVAGVVHSVSQDHGAAVLLVAHDVNSLLPYVDRVCYLAGGHMVCGKPDEVITSETLSRLYGSQVEVLRSRDGRLVVVGQPDGVPCGASAV